jgi:hypothetical protein
MSDPNPKGPETYETYGSGSTTLPIEYPRDRCWYNLQGEKTIAVDRRLAYIENLRH